MLTVLILGIIALSLSAFTDRRGPGGAPRITGADISVSFIQVTPLGTVGSEEAN
jgi:hypothetical protein